MEFILYWLVSNDFKYTYIGFTDNIKRRIIEHQRGKVKTTKSFNGFRCFVIEKVITIQETRKREKYWKSAAGRKKLKEYFNKIK
ncbi:MAG: GIY-YIG nuclease family protein [bacterium]|nr:GIY-YIG nuclease family protein [bacterium]